MEVMFERVAGLDVGEGDAHRVRPHTGWAGPAPQRDADVQDETGSLAVMRDWLLENGVTIAAMESTSTYWKAALYCLEDHMEVWLLNAAHMHAVPGPQDRLVDRTTGWEFRLVPAVAGGAG